MHTRNLLWHTLYKHSRSAAGLGIKINREDVKLLQTLVLNLGSSAKTGACKIRSLLEEAFIHLGDDPVDKKNLLALIPASRSSRSATTAASHRARPSTQQGRGTRVPSHDGPACHDPSVAQKKPSLPAHLSRPKPTLSNPIAEAKDHEDKEELRHRWRGTGNYSERRKTEEHRKLVFLLWL